MALAPRTLISAERIAERVRDLGAQISRDYADKDIVLLSILKGSFVFAADLAREISVPARVEFLGVRSYGLSTKSSGVVEITLDLAEPVEGVDLLLVEDIVDTGLTLSYLVDQLRSRRPKSLRVCALLDKPSRRVRPVTVDYLGFSIEDVFVVGYGLDHGQRFRNLRDICVVDP